MTRHDKVGVMELGLNKLDVSDIRPTVSVNLVSEGLLFYLSLFRVCVSVYSLCQALLSDVMDSILDFLLVFTPLLVMLQELDFWSHRSGC